jgi:hypothetical protein
VSREVNDLLPLSKAAALAGVQLSVLLEEPDASMTDEGRRELPIGEGTAKQADPGQSRRRREDDMLLVNGAQTLTDMLGGTFHRVVGNADASFNRVLVASSAVYRLGVELPSGTAPGKEFTVSASVKRPGLTAKANRLAVSAAPVPVPSNSPSAAKDAPPNIITAPVPASIDDVLKAALNANTVSADVPIRIAATVRRSTNVAGQLDISINVAMPAGVKGPVTTLVGLVDSMNAIKVSRRVLDASTGADYALSALFPVSPGEYRIRFAAADSAGAIGTIELPLNATLSPLGRFTASDVLTWYVDSANRAQLFAIEDLPPGLETLHASLELYPVGEMPTEPQSVRWTLSRDGESAVLAEQESVGRPGATQFRADAEFAVASLPPGAYVVRATLMVNDQPAGTKSAVVRKR